MVGLNREHLEAALNRVQSDFVHSETHQKIDPGIQFDIHLFDQLESTNKTLWQLINRGAATGTVAIANQQTSGRGQWGRQWNSPQGGLYLSVALAPNLPVSKSFQLTLATVWGIATALRAYHLPVLIKWPNDLILNQRKLGGILTETKIQSETVTKAVVGVGINWENSVPETGINLKSYQTEHDLQSIESLEMLAAITLNGIASGTQLILSEGVEKLLSGYLALLANLGQTVEVEGRPGVITGVTATGDLRVKLEPQTNPPTNSSRIVRRSPQAKVSQSEIFVKPGTIRLGYDTL